jgi:tyrosyl-tRNA synthetase
MIEPQSSRLIEELRNRALLHQCTNLEALSEHLKIKRFVYAGFDPTRDSLTIGNMVSILLLRRFQLAGHTPVVLMGGGTGLIGDPSGKDAERQLMTEEIVEENVAGQRKIFETLLDFDGPNAAVVVNNADWIKELSFVRVLRDVGKHFSVNMMIQKDSVKSRLEGREHGISYTEFSYMILQAYDFCHLSQDKEVTLQLGGSDQWGNIVAGVELTRKTHKKEVFGLTTPLVTKSDGGKFGKTESGAVWLTAERTSPYAFYQFWINATDADVSGFLRVFSLRPLAEIETLIASHQENPGARAAQKALGAELTELLHGKNGLRDAILASEALFSGRVKELSLSLLGEAFSAAPSSNFERGRLEAGISIIDLMKETQVAKSNREARQFVQSGAVSINGEKVGEDCVLNEDALLHDAVVLLRRGKKTWHLCRFT